MNREDFLLSGIGLFLSRNCLSNIKEKDIIFSNYSEVTHYYDGSEMNKSKCDGYLYVCYKIKYYVITESRLNIKLFGASGDGAEDDYLSLQKAIDFCAKNKGSLYVSRPEKTYLSSKKLIIKDQIYMEMV